MNNKVRVDKNAICLHSLPYILNICIKFEFLISQGSVATFLRWGGWCHMGLVANLIRFPAVQTFWQLIKIWQSYREFKGGNFFETQIIRPLLITTTNHAAVLRITFVITQMHNTISHYALSLPVESCIHPANLCIVLPFHLPSSAPEICSPRLFLHVFFSCALHSSLRGDHP